VQWLNLLTYTAELIELTDRFHSKLKLVELKAPVILNSIGRRVADAIERDKNEKESRRSSLSLNPAYQRNHVRLAHEQHVKRRLVVISTSTRSKGYQDFDGELSIPHDTEYQKVFLDNDYAEDAIIRKVRACNLRSGDVLAIVRGGGDLKHQSFLPFVSTRTAQYLKEVDRAGVVVIVGVGHTTDTTSICQVASIVAKTPSFAAMKVNDFLRTTQTTNEDQVYNAGDL